ncbi:MAG: hypothetical protein P8176_10485 [Gammaproteobacteria bacterium]
MKSDIADALRVLRALNGSVKALASDEMASVLSALNLRYVPERTTDDRAETAVGEVVVPVGERLASLALTVDTPYDFQPDNAWAFPVAYCASRKKSDYGEKESILSVIGAYETLKLPKEGKISTPQPASLWLHHAGPRCSERPYGSKENDVTHLLLPNMQNLASSRKLDIPRVVRQLAQRQVITAIPYEQEWALPAEIWVYVDFHARRAVYQRDIAQLTALIAKQLGGLGIGAVVEVWERRQAMSKWSVRRWKEVLPPRVRGPLPVPDDAAPCLLITDEPEDAVWKGLSYQLRARDCRVMVAPYIFKGLGLKGKAQRLSRLTETERFTEDDAMIVLSALSLTPQRFPLGLVRALREGLTTAGPALEHHILSYPGIVWSLYDNCGEWRSGYRGFHDLVQGWGCAGEHQSRVHRVDANKVHEIINEHLKDWYPSVHAEYLLFALGLMPPSWSEEYRVAALQKTTDYYRRMSQFLLENKNRDHCACFLESAWRLGGRVYASSGAARDAFTVALRYWTVQGGERTELTEWNEALWHELVNELGEPFNKKSGYLRGAGNRLEVVALESGEEPEDAAFGVTVAALDDVKSLMGVPERLVTERLFRSSGDSSIEPVTHRIQSRHEIIELKGCVSTDFFWAQSLSVTDEGVLATTEDFTLFWPSSGEHG